MVLRHLERAFPGLLVSTEEVRLAPGSEMPVLAMGGTSVASNMGARYWHLGLGNLARGTLLDEPRFIPGDRKGIWALLLDCDDQSMQFLIAKLPEDRLAMYHRPLEVLLTMLADDLSDTYRIARFGGLGAATFNRDRLETQWDRIDRPVALISSDLRIHGPSEGHARLRPAAALDHDHLHETVDDLARGRRDFASVTIGQRRHQIAVDLRTAMASRTEPFPKAGGRIIATVAR